MSSRGPRRAVVMKGMYSNDQAEPRCVVSKHESAVLPRSRCIRPFARRLRSLMICQTKRRMTAQRALAGPLARLGCVSDGFGQLFPPERMTLVLVWGASSYTNILLLVRVWKMHGMLCMRLSNLGLHAQTNVIPKLIRRSGFGKPTPIPPTVQYHYRVDLYKVHSIYTTTQEEVRSPL